MISSVVKYWQFVVGECLNMIRINYTLPSASDIQVNWNVAIF